IQHKLARRDRVVSDRHIRRPGRIHPPQPDVIAVKHGEPQRKLRHHARSNLGLNDARQVPPPTMVISSFTVSPGGNGAKSYDDKSPVTSAPFNVARCTRGSVSITNTSPSISDP